MDLTYCPMKESLKIGVLPRFWCVNALRDKQIPLHTSHPLAEVLMNGSIKPLKFFKISKD